MRTKINKLKKALIANGQSVTFSESFNFINPEVIMHGFYKNQLFGFTYCKGIIKPWDTLSLTEKENTINLLKDFKLWQE
jgi:hypothetical protein